VFEENEATTEEVREEEVTGEDLCSRMEDAEVSEEASEEVMMTMALAELQEEDEVKTEEAEVEQAKEVKVEHQCSAKTGLHASFLSIIIAATSMYLKTLSCKEFTANW